MRWPLLAVAGALQAAHADLRRELTELLRGCGHEVPDRCPALCKGAEDCSKICEQVRIQICSDTPVIPPADPVSASVSAASAATAAIKEAVKDAVRRSNMMIHEKWAKIGNATVEAIHSTEDFTNVAATQAASAVSKAAADGAVVSTLKYARQVGEIAAAAAVTEPTPVPPVNATNATNATVDPNAADVTLTVTPGSTVRIDVQAAPAPAPAPAFFLQAYSEH